MDAKPTSELFFPGVDATNGSMPLFFMALSNTIHKSLNELHRVTSATQYDIQLLEFDFPFAAAWICAFPTMVQMLELPDHGYGHVASVVGGRTIFIHAIRPDNTADDIMALAAATEQYYPMQVGKVSPQVFWIQGTKWRSLALKEGRGIFLPEDFPVKRNADGAPLMSDGRAGIRV